MTTKDKSIWILIVFILAGLVVGGLIGNLAQNVPNLWWLSYGQEFGLSTPVNLNLQVISITFGLMFKINIASILGIVIAIFLYRFMR